mmetsp:Transcript_42259/g.113007  ORF Transcript_42259/g.113007 Transcript_42259/m.113007 type:complete len:84 (-) Transcript_42259:641-892(-)
MSVSPRLFVISCLCHFSDFIRISSGFYGLTLNLALIFSWKLLLHSSPATTLVTLVLVALPRVPALSPACSVALPLPLLRSMAR